MDACVRVSARARTCVRSTAVVMPHRDFLQNFGEVERTKTLTGYNAMTEDYTNMSVIILCQRK